METQSFEYRGYRIVVTHVSPFWQAAIHPTHRNLPTIDCTSAPIRAVDEKVAEGEAQRRINEALGMPDLIGEDHVRDGHDGRRSAAARSVVGW